MGNKQIWLVVLIIVVFVLTMVLAVYLQGGGAGFQTLDPNKRFTARAGTTRKQAVALSSNKRPSQAKASSANENKAAASTKKRTLPIRSLSEQDTPEALSPIERLIREALNALSPETGLELLNTAFKDDITDDEEALVRAAMGVLYAQSSPPITDKADAAFTEALSITSNPGIRQRILAQYAASMSQHVIAPENRERIAEMLSKATPATSEALQLGLMLGQLDESSGAPESAAGLYQQLLDGACAKEETPKDKESLEALRLMAIRLTRIYRTQGRGEEADDLVKRVAPILNAGMPPVLDQYPPAPSETESSPLNSPPQ